MTRCDASVRWMGSFSGRSSVIVRARVRWGYRPDQVPSPFIYHSSSASIHLFAFLPVSTPHSPPVPSPQCPRLDTPPVSPVETSVSMSPTHFILSPHHAPPPPPPNTPPEWQRCRARLLRRPFPMVHPIPIPPPMSRQRACRFGIDCGSSSPALDTKIS